MWEEIESDLDLQVYEPSLTRVLKGQNVGQIGILSANIERGGSNPETYLAQCKPDNELAGVYEVSVNYFKGTLPVEGRISYEIGTEKGNI